LLQLTIKEYTAGKRSVLIRCIGAGIGKCWVWTDNLDK